MSELTKWLARAPQPSTLRVERADGEKDTVRVGVSRSRWRDAESAVGNDAIRIAALADDGSVLRVWESENAEEAREKSKPTVEQAQAATLQRFAELLTDACDRAVGRHTEFVNVAFQQLGALVQLYATRNAMLEKAWHKLLVETAEAQAEAQPDPSDAIVGGIMQMGMAQLANGQNGAAPKAQAKGKT